MRQFDLGWFAAMVDGEGAISINKTRYSTTRSPNRTKYYLQVNVANTEKELVEPFLTAFGGSIQTARRNMPRKNEKPVFFWVAGAQKALKVLEILGPYFRSSRKRKLANLGIEFQRQKTHRRCRDPTYTLEQERFWSETKRLNKRGIK